MTTFKLMCIALLISGCAKQTTHRNQLEIEPTLEVYVDRFEEHGKIEIHDLILIFIDDLGKNKDDTDILGMCYTGVDTTPLIEMDYEHFWGLGDGRKEALIFHELGHCIFRRGHDNDEIDDGDGCHWSIMHERLTNETC